LPELDDLMRQSGRVVEAIGRIKEAVIAQQQAIAEEQARAQKREHFEDDMTNYSGEYKEGGTFTVGDAKKRRGVSLICPVFTTVQGLTRSQKAAPPGRCHSCNRAETPEWRRGPDGARTLCNACGLHYAKLTRKMAVNKNAALAGSNLRPKSSESH
jgi:GATA zinc finger